MFLKKFNDTGKSGCKIVWMHVCMGINLLDYNKLKHNVNKLQSFEEKV
jgi:hypothetical protein